MVKAAGLWLLLLALAIPNTLAEASSMENSAKTHPLRAVHQSKIRIQAIPEAPESTPSSGQENDHAKLHNLYPFPQKVVLIDVGHGGIDGGTSYGDILEKDINLAISRKLFMLLRQEGYHAILNRDADYALSDDNRWHRSSSRHRRDLSQRKQLSSEIPTKLVVSVHVNWGKNTSKRGGIVLHQSEGRSILLADIIQDKLNRVYHSHNHITLGKAYYLLNQTQVPAVIVETGFLSNSEDRQLLTSRNGQMQIAEAIADGIISYLTAL
ncbi:N-acetylmuramoyl-L-alanine amidase [Paenibacillus solani]|uniref:N-acetylmuramoyl-L-alanine amidase n=1 Tax=Paenibacillus solani TaxID=1705565 RepID=UPI003D2DD81A